MENKDRSAFFVSRVKGTWHSGRSPACPCVQTSTQLLNTYEHRSRILSCRVDIRLRNSVSWTLLEDRQTKNDGYCCAFVRAYNARRTNRPTAVPDICIIDRCWKQPIRSKPGSWVDVQLGGTLTTDFSVGYGQFTEAQNRFFNMCVCVERRVCGDWSCTNSRRNCPHCFSGDLFEQ